VTCAAQDAAGNTSQATFNVTVLHTPPIALDDTLSVTENAPAQTVLVLANDSDVDGDTLAVTAVGPAGHGTAAFTPSAVTYQPAPSYAGPDSFSYTIDDGHGGSATASVLVTVTGANQAPVNVVPGPQGTAVNLPLLISRASGNAISVGDADPGPQTLRVTLTATRGTVTVSNRSSLAFLSGDGIADTAMTFAGSIERINAALDGMLFAPPPGFSGAAGLTIHTEDQAQASDTDTVAITVGARADLAVTVADAPDPATVGGSLTYSISVANNGPFGATTVTLVDILPMSVTFVSASASQGVCSYLAALRTVRCAIGTIANQGKAAVTLVVRPSQRTTLFNEALVGANQLDPNLGNNLAATRTVVR
jgi:uncharacterized repeat protein (TIGR01451 family)